MERTETQRTAIDRANKPGQALGSRPQSFSNRRLLERAFELARSGDLATVARIRAALVREGYSNFEVNQLALRSLRKQLQSSIALANRRQ